MGYWVNNDGLLLQMGTDKAVPEQAGEYKAYGANRVAECRVNLANLITANATLLSNTLILPSMANFYVEKVELTAEVGMSTASSPTLSIGVCQANLALTTGSTTITYPAAGLSTTKPAQTTTTTAVVPTNGGTAYVSALAASNLSSAGDLVTLSTGSTGAGNYIGDYEDVTNLTYPMYLTGTLGTHTATGIILVRIYYHGVGTIPN